MKLHFVIWVALALAACRDHEIDKLVAVREELCACKTVACGEAALKKVPTGKVASNAKSQRVAREMLNCLAELYELNRPTLDPDAEQPADEPTAP